MRLVQLYVPRGERASVVETLEAEGVAYGLTDETSDGALEFRDAGVDYELHHVYADRPAQVRVVVERPQGDVEPDAFVDRIHDRLEAVTETDLVGTVELIDTQRTE